MSTTTIPDNNLPLYFQQYKVYIVDAKDNKSDAGSVQYTTVGAIPSNIKNKRVWAFDLTGTLKPNVERYHIVYDFSKVESALRVKFEDFISGTFTICGQVLDATKLIQDNYTYSLADLTVIIELDTSRLDFRIKKETSFSYQLNINDATVTAILPNTNYNVTYNNNNFLINESSSVTLPNLVPTSEASSTSYNLSCNNSKVYLNYDASGDSNQEELTSGTPTTVNSYQVLYKGTPGACDASGTISFQLCDASITPVTITSGSSITIKGGLNVYNYYTIYRTSNQGAEDIYFDFIVVNIQEDDSSYSYRIIAKFLNIGNTTICSCNTLSNLSNNTGYKILSTNINYYTTMTVKGYSYDTTTEEGTISSINILKPSLINRESEVDKCESQLP